MPWIAQIPFEKARGLLKKEFDAAIKRAGRIWHIVHVMSIHPRALRDSMRLYSTLMHKRSPLAKWQREMLATVVSRSNGCYY